MLRVLKVRVFLTKFCINLNPGSWAWKGSQFSYCREKLSKSNLFVMSLTAGTRNKPLVHRTPGKYFKAIFERNSSWLDMSLRSRLFNLSRTGMSSTKKNYSEIMKWREKYLILNVISSLSIVAMQSEILFFSEWNFVPFTFTGTAKAGLVSFQIKKERDKNLGCKISKKTNICKVGSVCKAIIYYRAWDDDGREK